MFPMGLRPLSNLTIASATALKPPEPYCLNCSPIARAGPTRVAMRLANPWTASLSDYDEQKAHWETASGAYLFRLAYDQTAWNRNYVLTATFQSSSGRHALFLSNRFEGPKRPESHEQSTSSIPIVGARGAG